MGHCAKPPRQSNVPIATGTIRPMERAFRPIDLAAWPAWHPSRASAAAPLPHCFRICAPSPARLRRPRPTRITALVLDGRIATETRLPSERELAAALRISRATVTAAYDALRADGFLASRTGSGSFVTVPRGIARRVPSLARWSTSSPQPRTSSTCPARRCPPRPACSRPRSPPRAAL